LSKNNILTDEEITLFIRNNILSALKKCKGRIYGENGAAKLLGCAPTTLCSRIKKHKILTTQMNAK